MKPVPTIARHEAIGRDELLVHEWRVRQLTRLGIPGLLAEGAARRVNNAVSCPAASGELSSCRSSMTSVMPPRASASSESTLSAIAAALNPGVAAGGSASPAVPAAWRTASSRASQNCWASSWSRCTCMTASRCRCPGRSAHARSRHVFPLPAGAEMIVTFRAAARSRAATRSPRSISRGAAGATVKGLS